MKNSRYPVWSTAATAVLTFGTLALSPAGAALPLTLTQQSQGATAQSSPTSAPPMPVEEIIRKFASKESEFREVRNNYTYTQSYVIQDDGPEGRGEFRQISDIVFTPEGKRYEKITSAPPSTLANLTLSQEDMNDLQGIQPFVLTLDELPKYDVTYVGHEKIDEITAYVFKVAPKKMEKNQRYFEGTIWVDDQDLQIVKSAGKAVPDIRKGNNENLFPHFETYREQIDGKYWFPTYTRADDTLHFKSGDVRMHVIIRYTNYKQFRSTIRIIPVDPPKKQP
jgi:hypothetical protein